MTGAETLEQVRHALCGYSRDSPETEALHALKGCVLLTPDEAMKVRAALDPAVNRTHIRVQALALLGGAAVSEQELLERIERLEEAILTMATWLVQAQTGFGAQDARGIEKIVRGEPESEDK